MFFEDLIIHPVDFGKFIIFKHGRLSDLKIGQIKKGNKIYIQVQTYGFIPFLDKLGKMQKSWEPGQIFDIQFHNIKILGYFETLDQAIKECELLKNTDKYNL